MPIILPKRIKIKTLPRSSAIWRVHRTEHDPLWFGPAAGMPPQGRFDAPGGQFGVCYFGGSLAVAVLETLVRGSHDRVLDCAMIEARSVTHFTTHESLRLLQFEGAGLVSLGLGAERAHAAEYKDTQQMMLEPFEQHPEVDGIRYRSRWDNSLLCYVLFERARSALSRTGTRWLGDPAVIGSTLDRYELEIV
jgi:hypothetical protein